MRHLKNLGLADVQYLYGHAALVAADLFQDRVKASVQLPPMLELSVRTRVLSLPSHLLALRQHLTTTTRQQRLNNYNNRHCSSSGGNGAKARTERRN